MSSLSSRPPDVAPVARHRRQVRPDGRRRRRLLVVLAVVVLAAAGLGGWGIDRVVSGSAASSAGHLLVYLRSGQIAREDPDGTHVVAYTSIGFIGGGGVTSSANGKVLVSGAGDIITLHDGRPAAHNTTLYTPISMHNGIISSDQPFADGGKFVVFEQGADGNEAPNDPLIVPLGKGAVSALGPGDDYAGDPTQEAAWVADPTAQRPTGSQEQADTAVDHRLPGGASTTLITAAQLDTDLALPASTPLNLVTEPDPTGRYLMVSGDRAATGQSVGAVIVTRAGALIGKVPVPTDGQAAWSPSGSYLLVTSPGRATILSATAKIAAPLTLPGGERLLNSCVWSPAETQLACAAAARPGDQFDNWLLINRPKRTVTPDVINGIPVLWTKN